MTDLDTRLRDGLRREAVYAPFPSDDWSKISSRLAPRPRRLGRILVATAVVAVVAVAVPAMQRTDPVRRITNVDVRIFDRPGRGSGHIVTKPVAVTSVRELRVRGPIHVQLSRGPQPSLTLRADDNLIDLFDVDVSGDTVTLGLRRARIADGRFVADLVVSDPVSVVETSAVGRVTSEDTVFGGRDVRLAAAGVGEISGRVDAQRLVIEASGASRMTLTGTAATLEAIVNGASRVDASGVDAEAADVNVDGASSLSAAVRDRLSMDVSGASHFGYRGSPRIERQKVTGASRVTGA